MIHSIAEKAALVKFRQEVSDVIQNVDDDYLIRWLRARNMDSTKAKQMLVQNLAWRGNNSQLKNLTSWMPPDDVYQDITFAYTGFDYTGHPVLFMPCGLWNMKKLIDDGYKEEMFQYFYKIMEDILNRIERAKLVSRVTQIVAIFDVAGLTLSKIASIETMYAVKRFFQEFESYYPEILSKVYIINAHWVFHYGFKMVKPLISPNTVDKIEIFTDKATWKSVLEKVMPHDCFPPQYRDISDLKKLTTHMSCP